MPEKVSTSANSNVEILWDVEIDGKVTHNKLDITVKEKDARKWYFLDVTISQDHRVAMKENEKIDKYLEQAKKARNEHHVKVEIIPIVTGAMGKIPKQLKIPNIIGGAQTSLSITTGRILGNALSL